MLASDFPGHGANSIISRGRVRHRGKLPISGGDYDNRTNFHVVSGVGSPI